MKKTILLLTVCLVILVGCQEQVKKPVTGPVIDPVKLVKWVEFTEKRFAATDNNLRWLYNNRSDPNDIREINLRLDDIDCRLEVFE